MFAPFARLAGRPAGTCSAACDVRRRAVLAAVVAVVLGAVLGMLAPAPLLAAPQARAVKSGGASKVAFDVPGSCVRAGGLQSAVAGTVRELRVSARPVSTRRGPAWRLRVHVEQAHSTPPGAWYPSGFVRGEVLVRFAGRTHRLVGPANARAVTGPVFPSGWTASRVVAAPAPGTYRVSVRRIVYNVFGGGATGGWSRPYEGFDLVCSGAPVGAGPVAYPRPRPRVVVA